MRDAKSLWQNWPVPVVHYQILPVFSCLCCFMSQTYDIVLILQNILCVISGTIQYFLNTLFVLLKKYFISDVMFRFFNRRSYK